MSMKLFATDYDGTLLYAKKIMQEDLQAINDWKEANNQFAIVTGRSMESIMKQVKEYNLPVDYLVTNNGGMVFDRDGKCLLSNYLDYITTVDIIYAAKMMEGVTSYVVNDGVNRHRIVVDASIEEHRYSDLEPDLSEEEVLDMGKYAQLVLSMTDVELALQMADAINANFGETVVAYANQYVVDVVPKGISKATGLDFVCEWIGVSEDDTYTIGDSYNDIPLMEYGAHGSAIETAFDDVKEHARFVYASVHDMIKEIINK